MTKFYCCGKSNIGRKRHNNEDVFFVRPELGVLSVADGMGGVAFGEVASQIFKNTTLEVFSDKKILSEQETPELARKLIEKAFRVANENVLNHTLENPSCSGMGCTAELVVFNYQNFVIGHVGDSRTYLYRKGRLRQITKDHSLIQNQIDQGLISKNESKKTRHRNIIYRAVGMKGQLSPDVIEEKYLPGDIFLLCTDGLTDMVDDSDIENELSCCINLHDKVENLINLANSAGGYDNITVALCEIME